MHASANPTVAVIGLGYVGLPLAVALADHFPTIGYDIGVGRIDELDRGHDRTGEIQSERLSRSPLTPTADAEAARGADVYIVTAPTPVDTANRPNLAPLPAATEAVACLIDKSNSPIIVFESTVYPGVTEDVCGPLAALAALAGEGALIADLHGIWRDGQFTQGLDRWPL